MKIQTIISLIILALIIGACTKEEVGQTDQEITNGYLTELTATESGSDDIRLNAGNAISTKSATTEPLINGDDYEIHFTDYYGDHFYMNLKSSKYDYYLYRGKWSSTGKVYDFIVIYNSKTKNFSLNGYYRDSLVMQYNLQLESTDYFNGRYAWLYAGDKVYNTLYKMNVKIKKGELPGAND